MSETKRDGTLKFDSNGIPNPDVAPISTMRAYATALALVARSWHNSGRTVTHRVRRKALRHLRRVLRRNRLGVDTALLCVHLATVVVRLRTRWDPECAQQVIYIRRLIWAFDTAIPTCPVEIPPYDAHMSNLNSVAGFAERARMAGPGNTCFQTKERKCEILHSGFPFAPIAFVLAGDQPDGLLVIARMVPPGVNFARAAGNDALTAVTKCMRALVFECENLAGYSKFGVRAKALSAESGWDARDVLHTTAQRVIQSEGRVHRCNACDKPGHGYRHCSKCKSPAPAYYCSVDCQIKD